jgi:hypothetical protein
VVSVLGWRLGCGVCYNASLGFVSSELQMHTAKLDVCIVDILFLTIDAVGYGITPNTTNELTFSMFLLQNPHQLLITNLCQILLR